VLVKIKARVPEVHSMLPVPDQLGSEQGPHQQIIDMYPTFVAMSTAVQVPNPGDLVWVDWGNRQNWSDPFYIRPVRESGLGPLAGVGDCTKPRIVCEDCSGGSYAAKQPEGDTLPGANIATEPFQGLPRLQRVPTPSGDSVFLSEPPGADEVSYNRWKKAVKASELPPGTSWMGNVPHNGKSDTRHKHGSRMTLAWWANTIDFNQDWELIYWFHGQGEFSKKTFEDRIAPNLKKMVAEGRNFVFVLPEFTWSTRGSEWSKDNEGGKNYRQGSAWRTSNVENVGGDFAAFHAWASGWKRFQKADGTQSPPSFISIFAYSAGGDALARAAVEGALDQVQPDRIFCADADFGFGYEHGGVVGTVWEKYVKNRENVWFTTMTGKRENPKQKAEAFWSKLAADGVDIKKRPLYAIQVPDKGHKWIGDNAIRTIADEHQKKWLEEQQAQIAAADATAAPTDAEAEENDAVEDLAVEDGEPITPAEGAAAPEAAKKLPEKADEAKSPPPQGPPAVASEISKASETQNTPDWKLTEAVKFEQNRVRVADYGKGLTGEDADRLLVEVTPGSSGVPPVKLHKLAADRWFALKAAAAAAGFELKCQSGWRKHRWDSREHYETYLKDNYGRAPAPGFDAIDPKNKNSWVKAPGNANGVKYGKKWIGYDSPHETGLAIDIKSMKREKQTVDGATVWQAVTPHNGSTTAKQQKKTKVYKWLKENCHKFGISPLIFEPWHWEVRLPYKAWVSGQEFTQDYAVKVTDMGGPYCPGGDCGKRQLARGPATGGDAAAEKKRCVKTNRGAAMVQTGPYTPSEPYQITGGGELGADLISGPDKPFGNPNRVNKTVTAFVIHETGGNPKSESSLNKSLQTEVASNKGVHFWATCEGKVIQTTPVERRLPHANVVNDIAVGCEVTGFSVFRANEYLKWDARVARGIHQVSHNNEGDIACLEGKVVASANKGKKTLAQALPTPPQCKSLWKLITWLSEKPPESATSTIDIEIAFPCVPDSNKFWWTKWNGAPTDSRDASNAWFKKHKPAGIYAHARIDHHVDGLCLEYYCLGRAQKLSHRDAYYAMVGALASGTKSDAHGGLVYTGHPKEYISVGKTLFKADWFNGRTYWWGAAGSTAKRKAKWEETIAVNGDKWLASTGTTTPPEDTNTGTT